MIILITAATSAGAHKLKTQFTTDTIILGDYQDLPAFMQIVKLPSPASMSYAHEMLTLCLDRGIERVYPLRDEELVILKQSEQLFSEYGIAIAQPAP